jgi:hypothetical protein
LGFNIIAEDSGIVVQGAVSRSWCFAMSVPPSSWHKDVKGLTGSRWRHYVPSKRRDALTQRPNFHPLDFIASWRYTVPHNSNERSGSKQQQISTETHTANCCLYWRYCFSIPPNMRHV